MTNPIFTLEELAFKDRVRQWLPKGWVIAYVANSDTHLETFFTMFNPSDTPIKVFSLTAWKELTDEELNTLTGTTYILTIIRDQGEVSGGAILFNSKRYTEEKNGIFYTPRGWLD